MGCRPGGLEVETAGHAVDIEHLTGEVQVRTVTTLQGIAVDTVERDAAAGDKLLFKC